MFDTVAPALVLHLASDANMDEDELYFDDVELINDLTSPVYDAYVEVASASDLPYYQQVVVDTCTKVQMFLFLVIIVTVCVALYKFFKIFF